jgi:hypothetical protein
MAQEEITIPPAEMERLKQRFGNRVAQMGRWQSDGSLAISTDVVQDATRGLGKTMLVEAAREMSANAFAEMLEASSASLLIERISEANKRRFRELCERLQNTTDEAEASALTQEIIRQIFPS